MRTWLSGASGKQNLLRRANSWLAVSLLFALLSGTSLAANVLQLPIGTRLTAKEGVILPAFENRMKIPAEARDMEPQCNFVFPMASQDVDLSTLPLEIVEKIRVNTPTRKYPNNHYARIFLQTEAGEQVKMTCYYDSFDFAFNLITVPPEISILLNTFDIEID